LQLVIISPRLLNTAIPRGAALQCAVLCRYDGQVFVKPPEVLTRDRLLSSYQVRPVLAKLRQTLLGAGVVLLTSAVLLAGLIQTGTDEYGVYGEHMAV
jgi:hypothetical protein